VRACFFVGIDVENIITDRLRLVALTQAQLRDCLDDPARLARELELTLDPELIDAPVTRAIGFKLEKMAVVAPDWHLWYTYWLLVIRATACGAGMLGFKGAPGASGRYDGPGEVEIGYGIGPAYRGQGYMTEAVRALIGWALAAPECQAVIAPHVLKSNPASSRLLAKVGMRVYEETAETISWRLDRVDWSGG
jgi:RimJ/RimL family protein N-acetyltransferase